ncbi:hypothetical protein [Oscillibacter sp.]|uniref:hypothetical protein n=1 Tax=Oscillibacter sp. TaxID=1945593 RepID=UPI0028AB3909|nr:hypothetical protein [Oscillibacter sp.]
MTSHKQTGTPPLANHEKRKSPYDVELPQSIIESFARFLVPEIRKFYDSEEGQEAFEEWQNQKNEHKSELQKEQSR